MGIKTNKQFIRLSNKYQAFKKLARIMGFKPGNIIIPVLVSLLATTLNAVSIGLLIPLVRGVSQRDFSFVFKIPVLKNIMGIFFDPGVVRSSDNLEIFLALAALIFLTTVLRHLTTYIVDVYINYRNGIFSKRIRVYMLERFLGFGKLYFDKVGQSYISTVLSYSGKAIELISIIQKALNEAVFIIMNLIIMFKQSRLLLLFTILLFPVLSFILTRLTGIIKNLSDKGHSEQLAMNMKMFNMLTCLPLIKVYSKEKKMARDFEETVECSRKTSFKAAWIEGLALPIQEIIAVFGVLTMIAFVAFIVSRDKTANLAVFMVFFYQAKLIIPKFAIFANFKFSVAKIEKPLKEVLSTLENEGKAVVHNGSRRFEGLKNNIRFENLSFAYVEDRLVLKNASCEFEKGKVTAIVGSTGSGKSTLINLILRLYECPPGTISIDGIDIREFTLSSLRGHLSLVPQKSILFNDTIANNLILGLDETLGEAEIWEALKKAKLYDFVAGLPQKLRTEIGDSGTKLSGGEQQRLSIARALLRNSEILILDEATSSLDSKTETMIRECIEEAVKGRTTIVIAHRLSTIKNADKIIVLEGGRVVEQGSLNELLAGKGRFYEHWEAQKFY